MSDYHDHHDGKFFFGLFLGGLLGAAAMFFMGTNEGKKAGKMLKEKGEDLLSDLEEKLEDLTQKGEEILEKGEHLKEQMMETIADKKDEVSAVAVEKLDSALTKLEQLQQKGMESTEALRMKFKNLPKKA